jgi:hypothetical protein
MGKKRTLQVGGVNIRVHTKHEADEYAALWKALHNLRLPTNRGVNAIMIGSVRSLVDGPDSPLLGSLYRFTNINPDDPWFDIDQHKEADANDLADVKIPLNLKPNLKEFPYLFDIKQHKLFFKAGGYTGGISSLLVQKMLENLSGRPTIVSRFGVVDHTVMTEHGVLERLLQWPEIRHIEVVQERPNPSDFDDDKSVYERMDRLSLKKETTIFVKANEKKTITPDEELKKKFMVAIRNGKYTQKGKNAKGIDETASSVNYPLKESTTYDPDITTELEEFIEVARRLSNG